MSLLCGKPVYMDDIVPADCLIVKVLHSPHAHALIEDINTDIAKKIPGIEAIYTYKDVPQKRFTMAGQTYPEPSPYDRLILDKRVRFVGDAVAIVAGTDEKAVDKALKRIKVKYQVLEPVLDFHQALDSEILVHPEENWKALCDVGADNSRNLCASGSDESGELEEVMQDCDLILENTYHTKANQQAMMETFRTYTCMDTYGRLHVISSTQIVFHVRRILAHALDIPKSRIRVSKPRVGGGFGAKQSCVTEVFPAFVTWKTGKPAKLVFSRQESQTAGSPRHEMEIRVRLGAMKDGTIRAIDLYTLSNTGAYGEHGPTTVGLSGHKSIPLYNGNLEAFRFHYDVVYTNVQAAGAYRGYGATQGIFALESTVNELADRLKMDPAVIREKNMVREGQIASAYYNEKMNACALDRCVARAKEMFDWDAKPAAQDMGNGKIRAKGMAMAMQGSGISGVDVGSATIKLNDDGFYALSIGAADMGTGCDTTLAQIAAECLECSVDNIVVYGADSDSSPYDSGSYASSTTYVTGKAVEKACFELRERMAVIAAEMLGCGREALVFQSDGVFTEDGERKVTLGEIAARSMNGNTKAVQVTVSHSSPVSPPPFMAGMVELEIDKETGQAEILDYVAVVDCGTPINSNLVRVQTEGGLAQGIGMALYENVTYSPKGKIREDSFMQ
ncbi:MAG: xanthine dehydrogenase family protein molybdopterin-binding subunit, partial [Firmicutes bacterium]|nr:xanthine dehydrogenase family protein molybdopterin-binding subunit [Bacillota bacterium]